MGWYRERLLPRAIDKMCGTGELQKWRKRTAAGLSGTVVEIGFGSGLNMAAYLDDVDVVLAVEPAAAGQKLAAQRIAASRIPVRHVGLDGESIPLDDNSCDGALCTFTLCTIPDVDRALAELRRVVKPGGRFHFLEHGLSPDKSVAKWQRRLDPIEVRVADGCHLTRDPIDLVTRAGFVIERSGARYTKGPKPWTWLTDGAAINPS